MDLDPELAALAARFGGPAGLYEELGRFLDRRGADPTMALSALTSLPFTPAPAEERPAPKSALPDRYEDLGRLGVGGMGEVRRVRDRVLGRIAAIKILAPELATRPGAVARFVEEARVAAQLQHPGLAPVYDSGRLPDGRPWFTMKEVRGRTLGTHIALVHAAARDGAWGTDPSAWNLHRLVDAFAKVCDAVAYAHARGVLHRDLKPDNVMIADHGEVLVLDWGLAKVLGSPTTDEEPLVHVGPGSRAATRLGAVTGTAAYMAPEQARGAALDARTDVYALGAVLYEILSGLPPYDGPDVDAVVRAVLAGPPAPPVPRSGASVPDELASLCARAMAREREDRPSDAGALAAEVRAWLDGATRRDRALAVVARADAADATCARLRREAAAHLAEAARGLEGVAPCEPEERKAAAWAEAGKAEALERQAALLELEAESLLQGALQHDPALPEAHAALVQRLRGALDVAEARGDAAAADRAEARLRRQVDALPAGTSLRRDAAAWLQGDGALTLITDPPGAEVELHRYEPRNRRLVPVAVRTLGRTPLVGVPLAMGSWLCVLRHPDRVPVRYPVAIPRGRHWDGVPPGASEPFPIVLPAATDLGPDDVYVPAGWFLSGERDHPVRPLRSVWCDAVVVRRFPVTNREYQAWLDALVAAGREGDALRHVPRERAGRAGEDGAMVYGRDRDGRFVLRPDADGDTWDADWPVLLVDWHCARACAAWTAEASGSPWRLPTVIEWEKAARGVDGRTHPWGDAFDPSWACLADSHRGRALPARVRSYPVDESVYGVRGCAGNVHEWCLDAGEDADAAREPNRRPACGGGWGNPASAARVTHRLRFDASFRIDSLGFRLARPWSTLSTG